MADERHFFLQFEEAHLARQLGLNTALKKVLSPFSILKSGAPFRRAIAAGIG